MSKKVYVEEIAELAEIHFGRREDQPTVQTLREFSREAQKRLAQPMLWFDDAERQALEEAIGETVRRVGFTVWGCAVLPNHVHILVRVHRVPAQKMSIMFKDAGREAIRGKRKFPQDHPVFSANPCHIYKDTVESIRTCVNYIRGNFVKHKLPVITYPFVVPYDGWSFQKKPHPPR